MGRELRRVPADWEHPKGLEGHYISLLGRSCAEDVVRWDEERKRWVDGFKKRYTVYPEFEWIPKEYDDDHPFEEECGQRPFYGDYMPDLPEEERTHYQMYECVTEGTPISPVMPDVESLCHWLEDNKASAFGYDPADYEWWMNICRGDPGFMMFTLPREST